MNSAVFVIEDNVAIPARVLPNAGPRESMYPIDKITQGQCFAVSLAEAKPGEDGTPDYGKLARQKQSQFSSLAKSRGISLVTRFFDGSEGNESPFKSMPAPCLGVWHDGPAKPKKERKKKDAGPSPESPTVDNAAPEAANGEQNHMAPPVPAPPAAVADEEPLVL